MRFCLLTIGLLFAQLLTGADKAVLQLEKEAQKAEKAGDLTRAYLLYAEAAGRDPLNISLWAKAKQLQPAVANLHSELAKTKEAPPSTAPLDPSIAGAITNQDVLESRRLLPLPELKAKGGEKDFDIKGDSRQIFEQVARDFGLEAAFDTGYQPKPGLRFQVSSQNYRNALTAAEAATDSFVVPLTSSQFLVANDTQQKRTELDRTISIVVPVPEPFSFQDIQEIAAGIRGTLDIQKLMVDGQRRLILMKDRATKVRMAQKLLMDLMQPRPQVAIEIELLSIDVSSSLHYGLSLPSAFNLSWFGTSPSLTTSTASGNYLTFGGGKSLLGFSVGSGSLFGLMSKSDAKNLLSSEVVTSDGQAASLHVGDKYPIVTAGYYGATTGTGQVYTPPPTFNFEDLGLILKVTPHVHGTDEMSLDVEAEFKLLGSQAVNGIPVISNRKFQSKARVRNGEWAVLAGLMTSTEGQTISGIPGLSSIPFMHEETRMKDQGETLVVLKPHILSMPPTETVTSSAWYGTETKPRSGL